MVLDGFSSLLTLVRNSLLDSFCNSDHKPVAEDTVFEKIHRTFQIRMGNVP